MPRGRRSSTVQKSTNALGSDAPYRSSLKAPDPYLIANKSPDREYRFLSKTMLDKSGGLDRRGWEVLTEANSKGERLMSEWGTVSSGTDLRYGDLVVGFMPKERAEMKREMIKRTQNLAHATLHRLRQKANALGMEHNIDYQIQRQGKTENF